MAESRETKRYKSIARKILLLRLFQPFPLSGFTDRPRQLIRLQRLFEGALGLSGHERIDLSLERVVAGERVDLD